MNAYHVFGVLLAAWAVLVSVYGITHEDFPGTKGAQRAVAAVSLLLAAATIGSAIYTGATEDDKADGGHGQAMVLRI